MIFIEDEIYKLNGAKQELPGFDEQYVNIVDYILKITEEIWEERAVWVIYDTYGKDIVIHSGAGKIHGVEQVVNGTIKTLSSFPDRKMGGEAVIWSKIGDNHFYSSHRIGSTATNLGDTDFGAATGKKVFFRTIADCLVTENRIVEEWLVRDNLHLVQQLGFDPVEMAKRDQRYKLNPPSFSINGTYKQQKSKIRSFDLSKPTDLIHSLFEDVWKTREFEKLDQYYHVLANVHAICEKDLLGFRQTKEYLQHLFASFPDASVEIERISANELEEGTEVAARWKVKGTHSGDGFFSPASGKEFVLPGISHYIIKKGKIAEEWMVFDGFDFLCQIHADAKPIKGFSGNGTEKNTLSNKKMIANFIEEMNEAGKLKNKYNPIFKKYFLKDITLNVTKPFKEIQGVKAYENDFWNPLINSFPDLENRPYILIGGTYEGQDYVSCTGNLIGTFKKEWLGIPPTNQPTWLRYSATFKIENNKVAKAWYFFDLLDVMRQAGFHFFPNRGMEIIPPAPMTADGIVTYETSCCEGAKTLDLVNAMLNGLGEYDQKSLDSMDQTRFWNVKDMMWYGPSGIGTTRGLKGFEDNHQVPFLDTFPSRGMLPKIEKDQFCQLGDGNYAFDFGFPLMYAEHLSGDWLGLNPTGKKITLRVLDYWRREGDQLKENWVMIDMIDILEQLGIDVFELLKEEVAKRG